MASVGVYYAIKQNQRKFGISIKKSNYKGNTSKTNELKKNSFDGKFDIFPTINQEDIYDFIRIQNSKPTINDEMIAKIINLIIKKMQVIEGDLEYGFNKISDTEVNLKFIWHGPTDHHQKYKIKITSLNI